MIHACKCLNRPIVTRAHAPQAAAAACHRDDFAVYGKKPGVKQKAARNSQLESHKTVQPMADRHTVGLLKTIRNVAFAHRSQHVRVGRFHTEEDVLCYMYMLDPFPALQFPPLDCRRPCL